MYVPVVCAPERLSVHNCSKAQKDGKLSRPFLLYDGRIEHLGRALLPYGVPVPLPPFLKLPLPVCGHPDLLVFYHEGTLYTYKDYFDENSSLFEALPVKTVPLKLEAGDYPQDIWLDHLPFKGYLIGREDYMPQVFKEFYVPVNVRQGYARCSALPIGDKALITADKGIAQTAKNLGAQVLLIDEGHICLPGYPYGFIGGAFGRVGGNYLFFGSLSFHPQGEKIRTLISSKGLRLRELWQAPLADCGGLAEIDAKRN